MKYLSLIACLLIANTMFCQSEYPEELGDVQWLRSYKKALQVSKKSQKPVLILFQEVPGCATCRNYGNNILSNPILVDIIQNEFVPLAIYNNLGGDDKRILDKYDEPTWNNPVVRIVDNSGTDLLPRLAGDYSLSGILNTIKLSYTLRGIEMPAYLRLFDQTLQKDDYEVAFYEMYCFWTGESHLAGLDGVIETEPGWTNGAEVVKVIYDSSILDKAVLDAHAKSGKCKSVSAGRDYKIDKDPQYYLKQTPYRFLPLFNTQKAKINRAIHQGTDPTLHLSPSQIEYLELAKSDEDSTLPQLYDKDFDEGWQLIKEQLATKRK